jgi:C-methyltransferase C-terminal domain/Putative zinc binding domain/Methyltransferase domain
MNNNHTVPCRACGEFLTHTFVDLGMSPLCESFLSHEQLDQMEPFYPLHVRVCSKCFLVQLPAYVSGEEIFTEYAYFSSFSTTWVEHARRYVDGITTRLELGPQSSVVELASNDGYLLQHFLPRNIPVLGIEPAKNVAKVAREKGVPTIAEFFGVALAERLQKENQSADLIIGNNVFAQVPDLNDFVAGMKILLAPAGVITLEFPHLQRLIEGHQFDTIYHEHYSYFSLHTTDLIFRKFGMEVFDVKELPTHGGSLRVYIRHAGTDTPPVRARVSEILERERSAGVDRLTSYDTFGEKVKTTKRKLLNFLVAAADAGKVVAGYGAPGKGNTLLNYCGIREDLLAYTVDRNPYKHGKYLPGTHIPIFDVDHIEKTRPDYLLILPWNLKDEIVQQTSFIHEWGGQHVVPIPEVTVIP